MDHQDGFWVNRALRGDHAAFGRLYTRYQPHLARFVAHRLPAEEVDDLVQEAFLQAFDGLAGLRQPKRFGAWLMGIALNLIHNRYRRMQRRPETASDHWELDVHFQGKNGSHASESAEDHTLDRLLHQALEGAVRELSPGNREALLLHYAQGLRYSEIAALLEVPLSCEPNLSP
jgi:RNA polymerase sigma-70 factor (ECF subfamily)